MCLVQNRWRRDLLEAFPSSSEKWWYRDSRVETAILWNYWSLVISKTSLCLRHLIKLLRFEPTQHWSISLQFYVVPTTLSKLENFRDTSKFMVSTNMQCSLQIAYYAWNLALKRIGFWKRKRWRKVELQKFKNNLYTSNKDKTVEHWKRKWNRNICSEY